MRFKTRSGVIEGVVSGFGVWYLAEQAGLNFSV